MNTHQRTGETQIIETLVQQYFSAIRCLTQSILKDADEADDATQETFIQAALKLDGYRRDASVKTWLYAIAINECRGRLRKRQVQQRLRSLLEGLQFISHRPKSPEEASLEHETCHELWQAVDRLDETFRLPVLLRYLHDLTVPEIALTLGLPEGTIHSRLHRARQRLQGLLPSPVENHPSDTPHLTRTEEV